MIQLIYRIIYNKNINFVLRNINKLFYFILPNKIKLPPSGSLKIESSNGNTFKILTNQTSYLTQLIFWNGGYQAFEYTSIFIKLVKKVDSFYDIGANIGFYSLIAASEHKNISVVGFEPALGPLFYFRKNVAINNFNNIKIEPIALSHTNGEIDFYEVRNKKYKYLENNLAGESNTGSKTKGRNYVLNKVKTTTLDDYVNANDVTTIDLIKMDTEGTENLILENSNFVLSEMKPIIICETLFNTIEKELEKILKSHGYNFYNHTKSGLQKVSSITRLKDNGIRNCFFVHPTKLHLIEEFLN